MYNHSLTASHAAVSHEEFLCWFLMCLSHGGAFGNQNDSAKIVLNEKLCSVFHTTINTHKGQKRTYAYKVLTTVFTNRVLAIVWSFKCVYPTTAFGVTDNFNSLKQFHTYSGFCTDLDNWQRLCDTSPKYIVMRTSKRPRCRRTSALRRSAERIINDNTFSQEHFQRNREAFSPQLANNRDDVETTNDGFESFLTGLSSALTNR